MKRLKLASRKQTELADALSGTLSGSFGLPRQRVVNNCAKSARRWRRRRRNRAVSSTTSRPISRRISSGAGSHLPKRARADEGPVRRPGPARHLGRGARKPERTLRRGGGVLGRHPRPLGRGTRRRRPAPGRPGSAGRRQEPASGNRPSRHEGAAGGNAVARTKPARWRRPPRLRPDVYASKVRPLSTTQSELRERIDEVVTDISELPDAGDFGKEVQC